ncbi:MFS transporter [Burkholderia multivorans]|uniref:MFS transporter n=1 Tax=Burkholderia multivorans TaxID=87883 RepID=UPI00207D1289|nr:MFS transporter [Burkholderia multivorans]MCO1357292.1 MFS transporter [Burkholderia multivorans]
MSEHSHAKRGWHIVGLLFVFMMINYADKSVLGFVALPMMRDLQLSPTQFGLLGSAFYLLYSIAGVAGGVLTRYVKTKWILLALAAVWAAVQFPMATPVGFGTLLVCRVLLGAGEGPAYPVALHAVYKWFDDHRRSVPTSIVQTGAPIGVVVAAPALTAIVAHYSWRAAFLALGVGLVWVAIWLVWGEEGAATCASMRRLGRRRRRTCSVRSRIVVCCRPDGRRRDRAVVSRRADRRHRAHVGAGLSDVGARLWAEGDGLDLRASGRGAGAGRPRHQCAVAVAARARRVDARRARAVLQRLLHGRRTRVFRGADGAEPAAKVAWLTIGGAFVMQVNAFGPQIVAEMTPASQRGTVIAVSVSIASTAAYSVRFCSAR